MPTGTVKFVSADERWGMISRDDREPKVFVHVSAVLLAGLSELQMGQRFSFEINADSKGRASATDLTPLGD